MEIPEICLTEILSTRTYNICINNNLIKLDDIIKYYEINKSFYKIKNCGRRSNEELIDVCLKYKNTDYFKSLLTNDKKNISEIIPELSENKKKFINKYIEKLFNDLSTRSQNALYYFLGKNVTIENINNKVLGSNNFNLHLIQNVGAKSSIELNTYFQKIKNTVIEINNSEDDNYLINHEKKLVYEKLFPSLTIPEDIVSELKSIIQLIDYLIYQEAFFNNIDNLIFYNTINIYRNDDLKCKNTLELAELVNLSFERIRQKKIVILKKIYEKLEFIIDVEDEILALVGIESGIDIIKIEESKFNYINEKYNTRFSNNFIFLILYIICSNEYEIIFDLDFILNKSSINKKKYKLKNYYLIRKNEVNDFDYKSFLHEINLILSGKNTENIELDLDVFYYKFSKKNNDEEHSINNKITAKLIFEEFGLQITKNNTLIIERNTSKLILEFAIEILNKIGKPTKLETIYNLILDENPNIEINIQSLRIKLNRSNEIIHFGRSSTYGLKKWEKENNYLRGGTIRGLISELLSINEEPIHVKIIYKHVIKYRPDTNLKSIKTNIYLCNEFIKFPNNLIGLNSKKYKINYNKKIESDIKVSEIINEDVKLIFNKILNEIKIGKSEFSLLLKKNILDSKVLEAIQLCHENYNKNSIELNFKDYLSIINEIKLML